MDSWRNRKAQRVGIASAIAAALTLGTATLGSAQNIIEKATDEVADTTETVVGDTVGVAADAAEVSTDAATDTTVTGVGGAGEVSAAGAEASAGTVGAAAGGLVGGAEGAEERVKDAVSSGPPE
jgi:hypothetical protein